MSNFFSLVTELETLLEQLNTILAGDENTTILVNDVEKNSVTKATNDKVNSLIQLVVDAAADIDNVKYPTTDAGISATTNGQYFSVVSDSEDKYLDLYKNESGIAIFKKSYPSLKSLEPLNVYNQSTRILSIPNRKKIRDGEFTEKPVIASDMVSQPSVIASIDNSGNLSIDKSTSTATSPLLWWFGDLRDSSKVLNVSVKSVLTDNANGSFGPFIAIGDTPSDLRIVSYKNNGTLEVTDSSESRVGLSRTISEAAFTEGDEVSLNVVINPDGSGIMLATDPIGREHTLEISDIPTGKVWLCWRRPSNGFISEWIVDNYTESKPEKLLLNSFSASNVVGMYLAKNDLVGSSQKFNFDNNELNITAIGSKEMWLFNLFLDIDEKTGWNIKAKAKLLDGDLDNGVLIGIGDKSSISSNRLIYSYLANGFIGVFDNDNNAIYGNTYPNMAYDLSEVAELKIIKGVNNKGSLIATNPSGEKLEISIENIPVGKAWVGWRGINKGTVKSFSAFRIDDLLIENDEQVKNLESLTNVGGNSYRAVLNSEFLIKNAVGMHLAKNDLIGSNQTFIFENDEIKVTAIGAKEMWLFDTSFITEKTTGWELSASSEITTGGNDNGVIIAVGDRSVESNNRRSYAYLSNGFIGVFDNNNLNVKGETIPEMAFSHNETATVKVIFDNEGKGYIKAISPSGKSFLYNIDNVPFGKVWLGWRDINTGYIKSFKAQSTQNLVNNLDSRLRTIESNSAEITPILIKEQLLPDSEPNRFPKGFTGTGLCKLTAGKWSGCWVVGDDGRMEANDGTPNNPAIHIVTPDFNHILFSINGGYNNSMQGVTVDTLTAENTIWCTTATNNQIRHYEIYGDNAGQEIISDRITLSTLGLVADGSALAFDSQSGTGRGALWSAPPTGKIASLIDCDPNSDSRVIRNITLLSTVDQFFYDEGNKKLYYSQGASGTNGYIRVYDLNTNVDSIVFGSLKLAQAIEGFYIDFDKQEMVLINDGGFHFEAQPALNLVLTYKIPKL